MKLLTIMFATLLPFAAWASTTVDEPIESDTNYTATVVSSASASSPMVCTNRGFRVTATIVNLTGDSLCVSLGLTCGTNAMMVGTGSRFEIKPPLKYFGPISVRNSTTSSAGKVLIYETWRTTP